jgi:hypothetical protein
VWICAQFEQADEMVVSDIVSSDGRGRLPMILVSEESVPNQGKIISRCCAGIRRQIAPSSGGVMVLAPLRETLLDVHGSISAQWLFRHRATMDVCEQVGQLAGPNINATTSVRNTVQHGYLRIRTVVQCKTPIQKRKHSVQAGTLEWVHASLAKRDPGLGVVAQCQGTFDESLLWTRSSTKTALSAGDLLPDRLVPQIVHIHTT